MSTNCRSKPGHKGFFTKHGQAGTKLNMVWASMKQRCLNPNSGSYAYYGGRGITVCQRWVDSFEDFAADMGPRPEGALTERVDNDGPYSPENCRWASRREQMLNTRAGVRLGFESRVMKIREWASERGLPLATLRQRIDKGWTVRDALLTPLRRTKRTAT